MSWLSPIACALLGLGMVLLVMPAIIRLCSRVGLHRGSEAHHNHHRAVCRFGGLALAAAFLAIELFLVVFFPERRAELPCRNAVVLGSLGMFALGFCDDVFRLGAKRKLLGQVLIALAVYGSGVAIETFRIPFTVEVLELGVWSGLITVLWLVGITNLLNLIDGMDGLAGGLGLMLMALLVYVGAQNGTFLLVTAGMTGALLGFLWHNFPPARVYLGDGGAYFVGFQIGIFALVGSHKGTVVAALIAPLFVLALPIADASIAILRRGLRGLPVFRADRSHLHHRLLRMGMSQRKVVLWIYGATLLFLVMGFVAFASRGQLVPILLGLAVLVLLLGAGKLSFSREWFAVGRTLGNSLGMRDPIQHALSLSSWLRHEAERCSSLDEFYQDLVFAARRMGFTALKISLGDREWNWSDGRPHCEARRFVHKLAGTTAGALELQAPACDRPQACECNYASVQDAARACPVRGDTRLFEVLTELLAESWTQARSRIEGAPAPVSARAKSAAPKTAPLTRPIRSADVCAAVSLPTDSAAA